VRLPPRVKVDVAGALKLTWKRQSFQVGSVPDIRNGAGAPTGGSVVPSRSAGMIVSLTELKTAGARVVTNVAGLPASIAARLNANGCGPR